MHPDEESNFRAAFAELHRRNREEAPPFEVMRERALREVDHRRSSSQQLTTAPRIAFAMAALCVAALAIWWIGKGPEPGARSPLARNSMRTVDELITTIEQHVERDEPVASSTFPTDILLAEHQSEFNE